MIRDLIASEEYTLVNNLEITKGGPWTWQDPGNKDNKSCLDLAIASINLMPYIKVMTIDSNREFTPKRVVSMGKNKGVRVVYADHFAFVLELSGLPAKNCKTVKAVKWNLAKPGGWEMYRKVSDDKAVEMVEIVENRDLSIDEVVKKVDSLQDKIKFTAFGKTKIKANKRGEKVDLADIELINRQSAKIEKEIDKIREENRGRCTQVFKMKELVVGPKKGNQEAHAIKDPENGELVVGTEEIKKVSLKHCVDVLRKNEADEEAKELIEYKSKLHDLRMSRKPSSELEVGKGVFNKVMKNYEKKKKRSYDFIIKAGPHFKDAIFKLCRRMIMDEEYPERFDETMLYQLYKGKGKKDDLQNSRFIHLKDWLPRVCDAMMVDMMKPVILDKSTIFQIGGQQFHRTQEHLFTLRSCIAMVTAMGRGMIFQLYDIKKFFD